MSGKSNVCNESTIQHTLKEQILGSEEDRVLSKDKRDVLVTVRMKGCVVDLLNALVELEILESRSDAIASIVESTVSSKRKIFEALKEQADDLKRTKRAVRELASRGISEELE